MGSFFDVDKIWLTGRAHLAFVALLSEIVCFPDGVEIGGWVVLSYSLGDLLEGHIRSTNLAGNHPRN
jgi:hypothetical protein